jgi:hypothetical protein
LENGGDDSILEKSAGISRCLNTLKKNLQEVNEVERERWLNGGMNLK